MDNRLLWIKYRHDFKNRLSLKTFEKTVIMMVVTISTA